MTHQLENLNLGGPSDTESGIMVTESSEEHGNGALTIGHLCDGLPLKDNAGKSSSMQFQSHYSALAP